MDVVTKGVEGLAIDPAATEVKWDLPLDELFRLALAFYKSKNGKAVQISYQDNLKLVAFTQQASHGPLDTSTAPPLGVLDVIGKDRRVAWQNLGTITRSQSMEGFIDLLDRLCAAFRPYVEAIKRDREAQAKVAEEESRRQREQRELDQQQEEEVSRLEEAKTREEMQKRELQNALNQQTFHQFKAYAEKQFPANPDQQAVLIRQLQTEHYHQYMQQLQSQFQPDGSFGQHQQPSAGVDSSNGGGGQTVGLNGGHGNGPEESEGSETAVAMIERANMWTRNDMKAFKMEVSAGKGDGVLRVGHGDTVTVRVPTHEGGSCLYWEFATDSHDIGFGVYFEWGKPTTTEVSVHISESDEEEEDPGEEGDEIESYSDLASVDDLESGVGVGSGVDLDIDSINQQVMSSTSPSIFAKTPNTIIVPIYRRDCHNEVYAGSHQYPGEGVYLLKFDNSYSLWRSKTLYYRVFYTR